ncbi:MAG: AMP-binding protein [Sulfuritalea sp.]|nr:AMP-binding protein [Sulfuritalea sp.]
MSVSTTFTAHLDTFARDRLPPVGLQPEFIFELPQLHYPERINCAAELLDRAVLEHGWGERTAIHSAAGNFSYAELLAAANRIARVLTEDMGLVAGNRVLLRAPNNAMLAACWFAVIKAGGIVVTTMPLLRAKELVDVIVKAQISHALCDARLAEELEIARGACPTLTKLSYFNGDTAAPGLHSLEQRMAAKPASFGNIDTARDDICLIAFTSGTTGKPKGTMHFHRDVMAICDCFPHSTLKLEGGDIVCGTPPLAFTFGLGGMLLFPLRVGAATVLVEKLTPDLLLQTVEERKVTVLFTAPTFYRMMAGQVGRFDTASLRKCVSAGEALPVATRQLWREATGICIIDGIGATEMLHIFISHTEDEVRPGATGKPIAGYRACILGDDGKPLPAGSVGRLAVKGPTGCRYLDDPRQAGYVSDGWNLTGDAYLMDADGYFFYQARTDDMIVSAGYNIGGPEVEDCLLAHPAVAECGVVGVPDVERGQVVKAFVMLKAGYNPDEAMARALQEHVKGNLAPYKYPRLIEFRSAMPRTETGKLQRFRLRG